MLKEFRWIWVLVGFFAPSSYPLAVWIRESTAARFVEYGHSGDTTELWTPGAQAFLPGPRLTRPREGAMVGRLDDGSLLVINDGAAERLDPAGARFTPTGELSSGLPQRAWLLAAAGGAVVVDEYGHVARYRLADNAWQQQQLPGVGIPEMASVHCAQMVAGTTLMTVITRLEKPNYKDVTRVQLFDVDAGKQLALVQAPFTTLECALGGPLLIGRDQNGEPTAVRAATVRVRSGGELDFGRLPEADIALRVPTQIFALGEESFRLVGPAVTQTFEVNAGGVRELELSALAVPQNATRVPVDASQLIIAGGQRSSGDEWRDQWDPDIVGDAFRYDFVASRLEPLPRLLTPRLRPFIAQLADGRVIVGGGREGGRRVLRGAIAECVAAWLAAAAALGGLIFLGIKVRPRAGTLLLALLAAAVSVGIGFLWLLSAIQIRG